METLTIAGLTLLALISLVIEYYTRLFSRSLGLTRRHTMHSGSSEPAVEPPRTLGRSSEPVAVAMKFRADVMVHRTPGRVAAASEKTHGAISLVVDDNLVSEETTAESRILAELRAIVAQLVAVEGDLARGGHPRGLLPLAKLAMNYDLDDLMGMSDGDLSHAVISYYRDVARTTADAAEFFRNTSSARPFADDDPLIEQNRHVLHTAVAGGIARGAEMVQRLRQGTAAPANGSEPPRPERERVTSS